MTETLVEIVTTVGTEADAVALAGELVEAGLVACAHLENIRSIYRWQAKRCDEREIRLTLKTLSSRADAVEARLRAGHPYETPMILRLPVLRANPEYAAWARAQVEGKPS